MYVSVAVANAVVHVIIVVVSVVVVIAQTCFSHDKFLNVSSETQHLHHLEEMYFITSFGNIWVLSL